MKGNQSTSLAHPDREVLVATRALKKHYSSGRGSGHGGRDVLCAVDGLDFSIQRREVVGLVGESGCGKSTLGRCLAAVERPTSGSVLFEGRDIFRIPRTEFKKVRPRIQMIFQDPRASLDPRMRAADSVAEPLVVARVGPRAERRRTVLDLMRAVGLSEGHADRFPHELSGGELQRVATARAIALRPSFLVADEPVSALDPSVRTQVVNLLLDLASRLEMSILLIIHDLPLAARVCRRVAVMYLGRLMEFGSSSEFRANPQHPYSRALIAASASLKKTQAGIRGEPESPINIPQGCRFRRRCPDVVEICHTVEPELKPVAGSAEHLAACHLAQ